MAQAGNPPLDIETLLSSLASEDFCYVTTTGRVTGRPHEIEIWFGVQGSNLYLLSGGGEGADWVKNMRAQPAVTVRIGEHTFIGSARVVSDPQEDALAGRLLATEYQGWREGRKMTEWARTALPVAIDIESLQGISKVTTKSQGHKDTN
jgi:deazaflavin-dependent oxidoreductase (nitroreductase family)